MNKILLHSCCAPCSAGVIEELKKDYNITIIYYNPNIEPEEEYLKRKENQLKLLNILNIPYIDIDYLNNDFKNIIKGYEEEKENGYRCQLCYKLRLDKVASVALDNEFNYFGTTLSVSPHKNSEIINKIGLKLSDKYLVSDFKKDNGYLKSIELAKKYNLYRQNYCGCNYSKGEK